MKALTRSVMLAVAVGALSPCAEDRSNQRPSRPVAVPAYQVATTRDLSMGAVRRLEATVSLPDHYAREDVARVAQAVVADMTSSQDVNAISVLFYGPQTATSGAYDVAMIEWGPNGRWGDAGSVRAGEYSTFRYSVSYNPPAPAPPPTAARLAASGRTGLLGAPLPEGARLTERTAGDPAVGLDPSERYAISASAAEIMDFFNEAMPKAG